MNCRNPVCRKVIPPERKSTARHCSDECYDIQKKKRSMKNYEKLNKPLKEITRNDTILAQLYQMDKLGKQVDRYDLEKLGFNYGVSTSICMVENRYHAKVLGNYCYHIDNEYKLRIWKLNSSQ